jgi:hypothetical protein
LLRSGDSFGDDAVAATDGLRSAAALLGRTEANVVVGHDSATAADEASAGPPA